MGILSPAALTRMGYRRHAAEKLDGGGCRIGARGGRARCMAERPRSFCASVACCCGLRRGEATQPGSLRRCRWQCCSHLADAVGTAHAVAAPSHATAHAAARVAVHAAAYVAAAAAASAPARGADNVLFRCCGLRRPPVACAAERSERGWGRVVWSCSKGPCNLCEPRS